MVLPVYLYGHPVLRKETEDIGKDYPGLDKLIRDMWETMYFTEGVGQTLQEWLDISCGFRRRAVHLTRFADYYHLYVFLGTIIFDEIHNIERCPLCGIALTEDGVCPKCGYHKP